MTMRPGSPLGLLRQLWRSPEPAAGMITLESCCAAFDRNRQALTAGVPGFPVELFQRADALRAEPVSFLRVERYVRVTHLI